MSDLVLREDNDGVATLTLNRPGKLNALSVPVFKALRAHIDAVGQQIGAIGLVIIRGAGKCFSAGHDLADLLEGEEAPRPNFQAETIEALANLPQPVIAAVEGYCYTGALELALAADLIVSTPGAKFADTHAKWALSPIWGLSQRLPRRIGIAKAREMMLTCRPYTGTEALAMGLVNCCFGEDSFDQELTAFCAGILKNSWFSHRGNKRLLTDTDGFSLEAGLAHEIYKTPGTGPDMQERIDAFLTKKTR